MFSKLFKFTLPETNIAPENRVSQKEPSIPTIHFRSFSGAMLVSGRVFLCFITPIALTGEMIQFDLCFFQRG